MDKLQRKRSFWSREPLLLEHFPLPLRIALRQYYGTTLLRQVTLPPRVPMSGDLLLILPCSTTPVSSRWNNWKPSYATHWFRGLPWGSSKYTYKVPDMQSKTTMKGLANAHQGDTPDDSWRCRRHFDMPQSCKALLRGTKRSEKKNANT